MSRSPTDPPLTARAVAGPVVGITPSLDPGRRIRPGRDVLYLPLDYCRAVRRAGGRPLVLAPGTPPDEALAVCDALVLSGGGDLPRSFDAEGVDAESPEDPELPARVAWERELVGACAAARRPLLGVCFGMQLINLCFGGRLHLDIGREVDGALDHGGLGRVTRHPIEADRDWPPARALPSGAKTWSAHHQAVETVAPGFAAVARAADGVIEAIAATDGAPIFGVEWHAEADDTAAAVYGHLVELARRQSARRPRA